MHKTYRVGMLNAYGEYEYEFFEDFPKAYNFANQRAKELHDVCYIDTIDVVSSVAVNPLGEVNHAICNKLSIGGDN